MFLAFPTRNEDLKLKGHPTLFLEAKKRALHPHIKQQEFETINKMKYNVI
jgi:hypothetical protein